MRARLFWPLTLRGTGAVLLGIVAFVVAQEFGVVELIYLGVLLLSSVVLAWASLWVVHRYGEVTRTFAPDVAAVGQESTVTVHAAARSGLPGSAARWRDGLPAGIEGDAAGAMRAVGAYERMRLTYRIRATRRGIREIGPFTVTVTDPFAFARRRVRLGVVEAITVTPAAVALPPLTEFPGEAGGSLHTATHQLGEGTDNLIPRAYLPGDSMRRINWRASAHHDELMVRQEEQESTPEATVVLDRAQSRWPPSALVAGDDAGFETAVTAVVSTVARLAREGYDVSVIETDGAPIGELVPAGDALALEQLSLDLATVVAGGADHLAALPKLFAGTMAGPVVVVTGRLDAGDARALAGLVAHSALPMLFAADPAPDALTQAGAAGWRAASLAPGDDLGPADVVAAAWRNASERGASRAAV